MSTSSTYFFQKEYKKSNQKKLPFPGEWSIITKHAEMSEWFKEHDWKSCVGLKPTGGSNPLLCAKN